eukprot:gnl/Spiro4/22821_TR11249_c0_g1_i2.p1 gnl/Spiro4/22821_TR11249_c0_g1~~gnl/Spiro4/22821_TR11249_c0_g1_i2.p1  ORF type:complete len:662 (-),score=237.40 gnl/Spiro4/22821_TR11249_c0_g1_i2:191-2092(-)
MARFVSSRNHYPIEPFVEERFRRFPQLHAAEDPGALSFNDSFIGDEGVAMVAQTIKRTPNVRSLDLRGSNIRGDGAEALADAIRTSTTLKSINLEWNAIGLGEKGFKALCDGLALNNSVTHVDLRNNHISAEGARSFAALLRRNVVLQSADLRWNNLGLKGGRAILEALKFNNTLTELFLDGNKIGDDVLDEIASVLQRNKELAATYVHEAAAHQLIDHELRTLKQGFEAQKKDFVENEENMRDLVTQMSATLTDTRERAAQLDQHLHAETQVRTLAESRAEDYQQRLQRELANNEQLERRMFEKDHEYGQLLAEMNTLRTTYETMRAQERQTQDSLVNQLTARDSQVAEMTAKLSDLENKVRELKEVKKQQAAATKLQMKEAAKLQEESHRDIVTSYDSRLNEMQSRIRCLEGQLARATEDVERYKGDAVNTKIKMEESLLALETRLRREETTKLEEMEHRLSILSAAQQSLQAANEKLVAEAAQLRRQTTERAAEYEQLVAKERDARDAVDRKLRESQAQSDALRTDILQLQFNATTAQQNLKDARDELNHKIREHDDDIRKMLENQKNELRLWSDRVTERESQITLLRKESYEKSCEIEQLKSEMQRRLAFMAERITGEIKTTFGQQSMF